MCLKSNRNSAIEKIFPDYFSRFELPLGAKEEEIEVYRACRTCKCDKQSFLPTFEEHGLKYNPGEDPNDPSVYSLSVYEKPKDVKRFAAMTSDFGKPFAIAKGKTNPAHGICQRTKERKEKYKSSHVDWWLYKKARPYEEFTIIPEFDQYLEDYNKNA